MSPPSIYTIYIQNFQSSTKGCFRHFCVEYPIRSHNAGIRLRSFQRKFFLVRQCLLVKVLRGSQTFALQCMPNVLPKLYAATVNNTGCFPDPYFKDIWIPSVADPGCFFIPNPGSEFCHPGSRVKKIPDPDPHQRIYIFLTQKTVSKL
jgi:hypothetical protein